MAVDYVQGDNITESEKKAQHDLAANIQCIMVGCHFQTKTLEQQLGGDSVLTAKAVYQ